VATALAMVQACGGSVEAASREYGVPVRTLYRWIADQPARIGETEKRRTALPDTVPVSRCATPTDPAHKRLMADIKRRWRAVAEASH